MIRRTLKLAFLSHQVRNAHPDESGFLHRRSREAGHLLQDASARVSEVLFRIANSVDLTGLSLEVDLGGVELTHAGEAREQGDVKKAG